MKQFDFYSSVIPKLYTKPDNWKDEKYYKRMQN